MTTPVSVWVAGARPRTLPAAVVPVVVGAAVAFDRFPSSWSASSWLATALALAVALSMQVGVNYANDYSDGLRGTDADRVGPVRLVASGLAVPAAVKRAALASFGVGSLAGIALSAWRAPWLIAIGILCIAAGWFYTGGSHPYGYAGFGELAVFVFFGVVATVGTAYVVAGRFSVMSLLASGAVGLLAVALLVTNNLRDIEGDARAGKTTLAVRLGASRTRALYAACCLLPFALVAVLAVLFDAGWALLVLAGSVFAVGPVRQVLTGASGRSLVAVLGETGRFQIAFGALLAAGLVVSAR